jgi:crossover junction endodeoxyribonuclease RuvC
MTTQTLICGVDPGVNGGIALLSSVHGLIYADDMPATGTGKHRKVSPGLVADWFADIAPDVPDLVVIERVHSMPRQGVASAFGFGRSFGVIEGVVAGLRLPVEYVTPSQWKKAMGVTADKDICRAKAIEKWPSKSHWFTRKKDADRAEAALLAAWAMETKELG